MLYQTDPEFSFKPQIRHGGCYFLAILVALSRKFDIPLSHMSVLSFYGRELADADTDVDNEMFIGDPQDFIDDYAGPGRVHFIGHASADYVPKAGEIVWGCWHREGTDFNHFTFGTDPRSPDFYDPWAREGSASVKKGKLIGQRIALIL